MQRAQSFSSLAAGFQDIGSEGTTVNYQEFQDIVGARTEHPQVAERVGTPRKVDLTVGIATYDDFDGAYFTVHALLLYHPEVMSRAEILILDNHPQGPERKYLQGFARDLPGSANIRYIPYDEVRSTAVRDVLFREAQGDVVIVLDTHVLLVPGAVDAVLKLLSQPEHAKDMVQGPMIYQTGSMIAATDMTPRFDDGMYGVWHSDPRGEDPSAPPFEIAMQGLAAFAMRRDAWPGINPRFRGWGGEEGYIQEKVRQAGGRVLCLPAFRWQHRFPRPKGVPYPIRWVDRLNNYMVGWNEIGWDTTPVVEHMASCMGSGFGEAYARFMREDAHPVHCADGVIVLGDDDRVVAWKKASAELDAAGVKAVRWPIIVSGVGRAADAAHALDDAAESCRSRGWHHMIVLDESWALDVGLLYALSRAVAQNDDASREAVLLADSFEVPESSQAFLPGPLWSTTDQRASSSDLRTWVGARGGELRRVSPSLGCPRETVRPGLPDMLGSVVAVGFSEDDDVVVPAFERRFGQRGLAVRVERLRLIERPGVGAGADARRDIAAMLGGLVAAPDAVRASLLFVRDDSWVLVDAAAVLSRALEEAASRAWDVMLLGDAAEGVPDPLPECSVLSCKPVHAQGYAFVVNGASIERVRAVLDAPDCDADRDSIGRLFDAAASSGSLDVVSTCPSVFSSTVILRDLPQGPLRHRFERI